MTYGLFAQATRLRRSAQVLSLARTLTPLCAVHHLSESRGLGRGGYERQRIPTGRCLHTSQRLGALTSVKPGTSDWSTFAGEASPSLKIHDKPKSLKLSSNFSKRSSRNPRESKNSRTATDRASFSDTPRKSTEKDHALAVKRNVDNELKWLQRDPYKVSETVQNYLKRGRFDEAELITKRMSKHTDVVVAWNLLITHLGKKDRLDAAMKQFNTMKKHGQFPSAYTYNLLLTACTKSNHVHQAISHAMKIYGLLENDPRVDASIIHLNNALGVCSKAADLDSMFVLAKSLNGTTRKADERTYTLILAAFSNFITSKLHTTSELKNSAKVEKVAARALALWEEIMDRWRKGDLIVDEPLVYAMSRVLLLARNRSDTKKIFEIYEQVANIPDLSKPLHGSSTPVKLEKVKFGGKPVALQKPAPEAGAKTGPETTPDATKPETEPEAVPSTVPATVSKTVPVTAPEARGRYIQPTSKSLGILVAASRYMGIKNAGLKYWNLLVQQHGVVPDEHNWNTLFMMLLATHSSATAAEAIPTVPDQHLKPQFYQQALKTCLADNLNPNAPSNATVIFKDMVKRLPMADNLCLRLYIKISLSTHSEFRKLAEHGDLQTAKSSYAKQIVDCINVAWAPYLKIFDYYFNEERPDLTPREQRILYNDQREIIATARHMYAAFNKVVHEKMVSDEELKRLSHIGARINRTIQQFYSDREEREPNLRRGKDVEHKDEFDDADEHTVSHDDDIRVGRHYVWDTTLEKSKPKELRTPMSSDFFSRERERSRHLD